MKIVSGGLYQKKKLVPISDGVVSWNQGKHALNSTYQQ